MEKDRILFVCTGNTCRSQMAEGFARAQFGSRVDVCSAGLVANGLDPLAVEAMAEVGIDISCQKSKAMGPFLATPFACVVTLSDKAHLMVSTCWRPPRLLHAGVASPGRRAPGSTGDPLADYRLVREEIRAYVIWLGTLLALAAGTSGSSPLDAAFADPIRFLQPHPPPATYTHLGISKPIPA